MSGKAMTVNGAPLGYSDANGGPTIESQIVAALATEKFYLGGLGLGNQGTNISNFNQTHPSFLSALRQQNLIPSVSWSYNAGAHYRLQSIVSSTSENSRTSEASLLPDPVFAFVDSTLPHIWLPKVACQRFERAFGLSYNTSAGMYTVNDTLHQQLLSLNPTFTFTIGNGLVGGPTTTIGLPYIITDYERSNFSISQARFDDSSVPELVPIPSTTEPTHSPQKNVTIGASIAVIFIAFAIALLVLFILRKRRHQATKDADRSANTQASLDLNVSSNSMKMLSVQEIDENNAIWPYREMQDTGKVEAAWRNSSVTRLVEILELSAALPDSTHELSASLNSLRSSRVRRPDRRARLLQSRLRTGLRLSMDQSASATSIVDSVMSISIS
ncbi:MAG: hypothetical protein Q9174_003076, partial [Haloplaca sp. 1 TL-2023]